MNHLASFAVCAATLGGLSVAQETARTPLTHSPKAIPVQPRFAGTLHLTTGTWTRGSGSVAQFGLSDNIYSNTAPSGYFAQAIGPQGSAALGDIVDEGIIPGTTNPTVFTNGGAVTDINRVVELQLAYCDLEPASASAGWTLDFYEDYAPCAFPTGAPVGTVVLSGLPSNGCWILNVDLTSATGTGEEFDIQAEGGAANPGYDGDPLKDSFGISWRYTGTGSADAGPFIAGDPAATDTGWTMGRPNTGSNTYYGEVGLCGTGSGYQNWDSYWLEDTFGTGSNCFWFGGYANANPSCAGSPGTPYAGFWMEISGVVPDPPSCLLSCIPGCVGAVTSTGAPAICELSGDPVAANNDMRIIASGLPPNQFGIFVAGLEAVAPMTINSGNGWLCINPGAQGGLGRFDGGGQVKNSGPLGTYSLDTNLGEWSVMSIPTSTGTYAAMSGITSHFQSWFRDPVNAGFNFTGSYIVTWL